jgi:hypothetical protein
MSRTKKTLKAAPKVTAAVIPDGPSKAEVAAFHLLAKSRFFDVALPGHIEASVQSANRFGKMIGRINGLREGIAAPRTAGEQRAKDQAPAIGKILSEVYRETRKAVSKHGPMHSGHEGYAVIKEEVDELWDEIKADRYKQASARTEAIQVAAMAVRYVLDLDPR